MACVVLINDLWIDGCVVAPTGKHFAGDLSVCSDSQLGLAVSTVAGSASMTSSERHTSHPCIRCTSRLNLYANNNKKGVAGPSSSHPLL